jgi:hypothetical protein
MDVEAIGGRSPAEVGCDGLRILRQTMVHVSDHEMDLRTEPLQQVEETTGIGAARRGNQ